jgi:protein-disulfide isomerase
MIKRVALCFFLAASASAELVTYQGKLSVNGTPFNGLGAFRFAVIGDKEEVLWMSKDIKLNVAAGAYAVRLGDSAEAPPISDAALAKTTSPKLRIWFQREAKGWSVVGPDVSLNTNIGSTGSAGIDASQGAAILAELRQIRTMLSGNQGQGNPAPQPTVAAIATVSIAGAPSLGKADAPLVLVEYTDFQCPFCTKFESQTFGDLKKKYVDTGKLRVVSRPLPLPFHPYALPAARAAYCADAQQKFWPMRENLFAANGVLPADAIRHAAEVSGLDLVQLDACSASSEAQSAVQKQLQEANAGGFTGTPSFLLGKATGDKVTGTRIIGAQPLASFEAEINKQLAAANVK